VSTQRELSRIFSSVAFHFHSQQISTVSTQRELSRIFPLVTFHFHPQWICTVSPQRELSRIVPLMAFHFHPQWICTVSPLRELSRILPLVAFHFFIPSGFISCLLRKNFHGFCPQWFFFYFKSPAILTSKGPFFYFCDA
jgi:hypothetical protein